MKLHEYFGCESQEELSYKLKINDSSVRELSDFYNYERMKSNSLEGPLDVIKFIERQGIDTYALANPDTEIILIINSKNEVINIAETNQMHKYQGDEDIAKALQDTAAAKGFFVVGHNPKSREEIAKDMDTPCLDHIVVNQESFYSQTSGNTYDRTQDTSKSIEDYLLWRTAFQQSVHKSRLYELDDAREFTQNHFTEQIKGLHIIQDDKKIQALLKQAYQHEPVENVVALTYSNDYRIYDIRKVATGAETAATLSSRELFKEAMKDTAKGIIIAHNHPSGHPTASEDDIRMTKAAGKRAMRLHKDVFDHFIVASGNVVSVYETLKNKLPKDKLDDFNLKAYERDWDARSNQIADDIVSTREKLQKAGVKEAVVADIQKMVWMETQQGKAIVASLQKTDDPMIIRKLANKAVKPQVRLR